MKKLLLILFCPILLLNSCSKSGVKPQFETNIEETIVGKTWKLLDTDYGWFHLNSNNTYLTKDFLCDTLRQYGTWELDENILIFKYIDGPIEYVERNTIIEYNDSIVKVQADTSANLDINLIFEITEAVIRGCMDSTFLNFNPNAQCPDTCINAPVYGCMDSGACNYDLLANIDDGNCEYITCAGCMDANALNYDATATIDDGSCIINGCTDSTATNYNTLANTDDGSCTFSISIGDTHQGGIIFWLDASGGHGLISAPTDQSLAEWGCYGTLIGTGTAIGTGNQNTIDIEAGCTTSGTAADICANLTLGGYNDWFLPSKDELIEMFLNIGQGNTLGLGNIGGFGIGYYWNSTEYSANSAYIENFYNPDVDIDPKSKINKVRAVRAF